MLYFGIYNHKMLYFGIMFFKMLSLLILLLLFSCDTHPKKIKKKNFMQVITCYDE